MNLRHASVPRRTERTTAHHRRRGVRSLTALVTGVAVVLGMAVAPALPAAAAGPAAVGITVSITDPTGAVVSRVDAESMATYSVNVAYSCNVADCQDVQVIVDPTPLDPTYSSYRKESAMTFTPPFTPAPPITGTLDSGYTVSLGSLTAGTSGLFRLAYRVDQRTSGPRPGSFFIDGSSILPRATISASNSDNSATGSASATWASTVPAAPTLTLSAPASTRTDAPVALTLGGDARCLSYNGAGILIGIPWVTCAQDYTAVVTLPTDAEYVPASGGLYDSTTRTVTFAQTGSSAAGGLAFNANTFEVTFPSGSFPTTAPGCVANRLFAVTETMTYIGGTVRTATPASRSLAVQNCAPFAKGDSSKILGGRNGGTASDATFDIPLAPGGTKNGYWQLEADNQANVSGIATITDASLGQAEIPVRSIRALDGAPTTLQYTLSDGATGSVSVAYGDTWTPSGGRTISAVTATSSSLTGPNAQATGSASTRFIIRLNFVVQYGATPGLRTNTATSSIAYEDPTLGTLNLAPDTATATLEVPTDVTLTAGPPSVTTTGTPIVGGTVSWRMGGAMSTVPAGENYRPQYVFLAPKDWDITASSATVTGVPGVTYDYKDVSYNGESYSAVVATWPGPISNVGTFSLPAMTVNAVPTIAAPAGTNNQTGYLFVGDVNGRPVSVYSPGSYADATDFDGDGDSTETYAMRTGLTSLAPTSAIGVTKQICRPDVSQADGCDWISDAGTTVGVPPNATSIKYRVIIANGGNASLSNVVAYDVLPYIGDHGLSDGTASILRGSTVKELLATVSDVSPGIVLNYSASTNPSRTEVYSGTTDPDDWGVIATGASSLRAKVATLAAKSSVSFEYEASLVLGAAGQIACNSITATATTLATIEPQAVCATTQEADLQISAPAHYPLQQGRDGGVTFEVVNAGATPNAPASVTVSIPDGVSITDLALTGWVCTAPSMAGPVTLACDPVDDAGSARTLALGASETITIPVRADSDAPAAACFDGSITGPMYDPELSNNDAQSCSDVAPVADPLLALEKTDHVGSVSVGDLTTYSITVSNELVSESIADAVVTDTLPAGLTFVSASNSGTASGQTVSWTIADLNPAGATNSDGSDINGGSGNTITLTVTARIADGAQDAVTNSASVSAPDPAGGDALTDAAEDTDAVFNLFTDLDPATTTPQNEPVVTALSEIVTARGAPLDPTAVTEDGAPAHGSIAIDPTTGAVTYTPSPGYSGPDIYQVRACDTSTPAQCHVSQVRVTVGVNVVDALDDAASTTATKPVTTTVTGNDSTASGQPLANPTVTTQPQHGGIAVNVAGTITYTPDDAWSGSDSYVYSVCDTSTPTPVCDSATVLVTVDNVILSIDPVIPTAQNSPVTTPLSEIMTSEGLPLEPAQTIEHTAPTHGSIAIDPTTGAVTYTPTPGYTGDDSYVITACDTAGVCVDAPVRVVVGRNVVTVRDESISLIVNTDVDPIDVLSTATSASAQPLGNPTIKDEPRHGTVAVDADGTITYSADRDYVGTDSFTFTVCDTGIPVQVCDTGTVSVTVTPIADPPPAASTPTATALPAAGIDAARAGALALLLLMVGGVLAFSMRRRRA